MSTLSNVALPVNYYFDKVLLMRAQAAHPHMMFGEAATLPQNAGVDSIRFRRYTNLTSSLTALTEGTTPTAKQLAITNVQAQISEYGAYAIVTDSLAGLSAESIFGELGELLADNAAEAYDKLCRDVIVAGTVVGYSGSSNTDLSEVAAGDVITLTNVQTATLALKVANAKKMTPWAKPTDQVGTAGVAASYWAICNVSISPAFRAMTGFQKVKDYPSTLIPLENEIGSVADCRIVETTDARVSSGSGTGSIDVYTTMFIAKGFYGNVRPGGAQANGGPISPLDLQFIAKPFVSNDSADPLNQRASGGWKGSYVALILNQNFGYRYESALV